jgi:hypothetical protein
MQTVLQETVHLDEASNHMITSNPIWAGRDLACEQERLAGCQETARPLPVIGRGPGATKPAGLALRFCEGEGGFAIDVIGQDDDALLRLGPFAEEDVVAIWRSMGAASGLPLMIARPDGLIQAPYPQIGRLQLGDIRIRRRHGLLNGRRPRFLTRRRTGRLPLRPTVFRGECEIAGGRGA